MIFRNIFFARYEQGLQTDIYKKILWSFGRTQFNIVGPKWPSLKHMTTYIYKNIAPTVSQLLSIVQPTGHPCLTLTVGFSKLAVIYGQNLQHNKNFFDNASTPLLKDIHI